MHDRWVSPPPRRLRKPLATSSRSSASMYRLTCWWMRSTPSEASASTLASRAAQPTALNQVLFTHLAELKARRDLLDKAIIDWAAALTDAELAQVLEYANSKGVRGRRRLVSLVTHFFNHQTHHRGQATTLFSQAGIDVGVTDLLSLIPNES